MEMVVMIKVMSRQGDDGDGDGDNYGDGDNNHHRDYKYERLLSLAGLSDWY